MITIEHSFDAKNATIESVMRALTTPAGLRGWWCRDCDIAPEVGGRHELRFNKGGNIVTMGFDLSASEPGLVRWTCTDNGNPVWVGTTLEWRFRAGAEGVGVQFAHSGFAEDQSPPYVMTVEGWKPFIASLQDYIQTGTGQPM